MNARGILDQLMKAAGNNSAAGGGDISRLLQGLSSSLGGKATRTGSGTGQGGIDLNSLLGGGAIGLLVGSKRGRKLGGKALKYGALAGIGVLAWRAWQSHQGASGDAGGAEGHRVEQLEGPDRERRSLEILQAMIMAARADGHVDAQERELLTQQIDALGADDELHGWVEQQLQAPLDAEALARQADSPQAAREIYLVSVAIVDEQNAMERAWLDELARALGIETALARELERQVAESASVTG